MGTNYFIDESKCDHCGHQRELVHIGKSSSGWKFTFHATDFCKSKADWEAWLLNCAIVDEYGRYVSHQEFFDMVEQKQSSYDHTTAPDNIWGPWTREDGIHYMDPNGYYFARGEFC